MARALLISNYMNTPAQVIANALIAQLGPEPDYKAIEGIKKIIVNNDEDKLAPREARERLCRNIGQSYNMSLPAKGHFTLLENPGVVIELLSLMLGL